MSGVPQTLTGSSLARAEAFFGTSLADVRVVRGSRARELGALGFAYGNEIHLDSRLEGFAEASTLGHELTHVLQWREGRTPPLNAAAFVENASLEAEANDTGRRFAQGVGRYRSRGVASITGEPVLQRSVRIGDKAISGEGDLSPIGALTVGLIDGGEAWLTWAASAATDWKFADEQELAAAAQSGLHGSPLTLLRSLGLLVHPQRLMELQIDDLRLLASGEQAASDNSAAQQQAKKVLAKYGMRTQSDLAIGRDFLAQTGVADAPVFQSLQLADLIDLFNLVDGAATETSLNPAIQKEAAAFAAARAISPAEFCDYYRFYLSTIDDPAPQPKNSAARTRKAEVVADGLTGQLTGALFCPSITGGCSPDRMARVVRNWTAGGRALGYARLSSAISQVGQFADLNGATGASARSAIDRYSQAAGVFLSQNLAGSVNLAQDGASQDFVYDRPEAYAALRLSDAGNITLSTYQARK